MCMWLCVRLCVCVCLYVCVHVHKHIQSAVSVTYNVLLLWFMLVEWIFHLINFGRCPVRWADINHFWRKPKSNILNCRGDRWSQMVHSQLFFNKREKIKGSLLKTRSNMIWSSLLNLSYYHMYSGQQWIGINYGAN